jgi:hypothetical protein
MLHLNFLLTGQLLSVGKNEVGSLNSYGSKINGSPFGCNWTDEQVTHRNIVYIPSTEIDVLRGVCAICQLFLRFAGNKGDFGSA